MRRRGIRLVRVVAPLVVIVVALVVGSSRAEGPRSDAERAQALAGTVRCPTCAGQSVASSNAPAAEAIRADIDRRVAAGETDEQIQAAFVASYGDGVLLNPPAGGLAGLVWVLPVAMTVVALGAVALTLRRWRAAAPPVGGGDGTVRGEGRRSGGQRAPDRPVPGRARLLAASAGVALVGVVAGVAVANASGTRQAGEFGSGEVRELTDQRLEEAPELARSGDVRGALALYDGVLEDDPANVEALSERGLLLASLSEAADLPELLASGRSSIERALEVDSGNPRSLFYRGLVERLEGDEGAAAASFEAALAADPPPALRLDIEAFLSPGGPAGTGPPAG